MCVLEIHCPIASDLIHLHPRIYVVSCGSGLAAKSNEFIDLVPKEVPVDSDIQFD